MPLRTRRAVTGLVTGAALLAAAGCRLPVAPAVAEEPEPLFPGVADAVRSSRGQVEPPTVERLNFRTGEPTDEFGRRAVARGYADAVWFATATTFAADTLAPATGASGPFTRYANRMTAALADETRSVVAECFDGDEYACGEVFAWRFYWNDELPHVLQDDGGPLVVNHEIREADVWVDRTTPDPQLVVRFEQRADVRVRSGRGDLLLPLTKDATYWLVPTDRATGSSWKVDHIEAAYVEGAAVPDSGTY